jgi:predicted nucleic acid-binding protein
LRILFDTNVVLDLLLDRKPHAVAAARLLTAVEREELSGLLCATSVTTLDYLISRAVGREEARRAIRTMLRLFEVAAVTRAVLEAALDIELSDYEDAVIHEAGRGAEAEGIVTRNTSDFEGSRLPIFSPEELVAALKEP